VVAGAAGMVAEAGEAVAGVAVASADLVEARAVVEERAEAGNRDLQDGFCSSGLLRSSARRNFQGCQLWFRFPRNL
jgi:hypothetical protein